MALSLPFLSTGPKVWMDEDSLHAKTSPVFAACTLGLCVKAVTANRQTQTIVFERTVLWLFKKRVEVRFDEIDEIKYKYDNMVPFESFIAADAFDCYSLVIEFQDRQRDDLLLFRWMGQGEFANNSLYPDIFYWQETLFDLQGTQKKESVVVFEALRRMVFPKPLGFDINQTRPDQDGAAMNAWSDVPNRAQGYDASVERGGAWPSATPEAPPPARPKPPVRPYGPPGN